MGLEKPGGVCMGADTRNHLFAPRLFPGWWAAWTCVERIPRKLLERSWMTFRTCSPGEKAGLLIRKHDHHTPLREIRRGIRALTAHNRPEGRYFM